MNNTTKRILAAALALTAFSAQALQITAVSPQNEIARVRQIVAKFDESAVNFGDPKAPAPLALSCSDAQATQGNGRLRLDCFAPWLYWSGC